MQAENAQYLMKVWKTYHEIIFHSDEKWWCQRTCTVSFRKCCFQTGSSRTGNKCSILRFNWGTKSNVFLVGCKRFWPGQKKYVVLGTDMIFTFSKLNYNVQMPVRYLTILNNLLQKFLQKTVRMKDGHIYCWFATQRKSENMQGKYILGLSILG